MTGTASQRLLVFVLIAFLSIPALPLTFAVAADTGPTGQEIYKAQCAQCHGANGEGVEDHCPDPLHGDRSLEDLTKVENTKQFTYRIGIILPKQPLTATMLRRP